MHGMRPIKSILYAILLLLIPLGCENPNIAGNGEENNQDEVVDGGGSGKEDDSDTNYEEKDVVDGDGDTSYRKRTYTVSEFIAAQLGSRAVKVEGYIVGACAQSVSRAEWVAPFTCRQAILLADRPGERDERRVMSVELKQGGMRTQFNLPDHPENLGRKIYVYGVKHNYLGVPGIKETITGYGWAD